MNRRSQSTRRSLASRISLGVASRLSVAGQREPVRHGTVAGVVINTLCNVMGAGVLSLPLATYNASVLFSILLVLVVALLACYAVYCLVAASDALQRYSLTELAAFSFFPSRDFDVFCAAKLESGDLADFLVSVSGGGDAGGTTPQLQPAASGATDHALSAHRRAFTSLEIAALRRMHDVDELTRRRRRRLVTMLVEGAIFFSNFGFLAIYCKVVIEAIPSVLGQILPRPVDAEAAWVALALSPYFWAIAAGLVFFLLSCTRDMEELKWTSLLGFLTIFYIVCAVAYRFGTAHGDPANPDVPAKAYGTIRWAELHTSLFRAMATYGLAFSYHVNVPYFYKELRRRELPEMMRSVHWSFPTIVLCYVATGTLGYLTFGDLVASPATGGNIVENYAAGDQLFIIGQIGLCLHFACVFPIVSICTRRGLHRLAMTLLTWQTQSETMMLAAGLVLDDYDGENDNHETDRHGGGPSSAVSYGSASHTGAASATTPLVATEDLDRDPGSPDDTTRLAIVVEALLLVACAMTLALLVPGISFVMDITGTLFSLTLMLVVPSAIGLCIFSTSFATRQQHAAVANAALQAPIPWSTTMSRARSAGVLFDSAALAEADEAEAREGGTSEVRQNGSQIFSMHRYSRLKHVLCVFSLVVGLVFTVVGAALLVYDNWPR